MDMSSLSLFSHFFFFFFFLCVCAGFDKSVIYLSFLFFHSVVMYVGLYIRLLGSECSLRE